MKVRALKWEPPRAHEVPGRGSGPGAQRPGGSEGLWGTTTWWGAGRKSEGCGAEADREGVPQGTDLDSVLGHPAQGPEPH